MMSGSKPYEIYLRTRDAADEEDRGMLAVGAASLLFVLIFQFRSIGVLIYYLRISEVESA